MVRHTDMEVTVTEEDFLYSQIPRNRRHSKPCGGRYRRRHQVVEEAEEVREKHRQETLLWLSREGMEEAR